MLHTKIAVVGIFAFLVSPAIVEAQQNGGQNGNNNGENGQVSSSGQISSQTSNQGFVGGGGIGGDPRATSNQGNMAGMGMNAMGGFGGFGGMGRGMMGGMFGGQQQQQQPGANLRFPFVVKFTVAPIVPAKVRMQAENRLTKLPGLSKYNKVAVQIKGVTATLTGQVVSQREKSLVERLVLLEPGINDVRNDLVIAEKKP
ncbi:MAG: hypothetical protein CMJ79_12810 [Planctomycetaceae bacterium]|nr:hypothetical protein [Planctomycetaceae bacterium]